MLLVRLPQSDALARPGAGEAAPEHGASLAALPQQVGQQREEARYCRRLLLLVAVQVGGPVCPAAPTAPNEGCTRCPVGGSGVREPARHPQVHGRFLGADERGAGGGSGCDVRGRERRDDVPAAALHRLRAHDPEEARLRRLERGLAAVHTQAHELQRGGDDNGIRQKGQNQNGALGEGAAASQRHGRGVRLGQRPQLVRRARLQRVAVDARQLAVAGQCVH